MQCNDWCCFSLEDTNDSLHFLAWCCLEGLYRNMLSLFYRFLLILQNMTCNHLVSNDAGRGRASSKHFWFIADADTDKI